MLLLDRPGGYLEITNSLLSRWGIDAPQDVVEALAKRIMFTREGIAKKVRTKNIKRDRLNERIIKAINHTNALLDRRGNGEGHLDKLCDALCSEVILVELAVCQPSFDLNTDDLNRLLKSLITLRDNPQPRTGRPKDYKTFIIVSAANVWTAAGKTVDFSYHDEVLKGGFPEFLMDVYCACGLSKPEGEELTALNEKLRSLFI